MDQPATTNDGTSDITRAAVADNDYGHGSLHETGLFDSKSTYVDSNPCACGKNGTAEAHGVEYNVRGAISQAPSPGYSGRAVDARQMTCDDVMAIRARVAADITRDNLNPAQRALSWAQGRSGEYTPEAYQAAWVSRQDPAEAQAATAQDAAWASQPAALGDEAAR